MEISAEIIAAVFAFMLFLLYRGQKTTASEIEKKLADIVGRIMIFVFVAPLVLVFGLKVFFNPFFWIFLICYVGLKAKEGRSIFEPSSAEHEIFAALIVLIIFVM